jgi:hypothetical protein
LHLGGSSEELKSIHPVMREIVEGFSHNPQHIFRIKRLCKLFRCEVRAFSERERDFEKIREEHRSGGDGVGYRQQLRHAVHALNDM